MFSDEIAHGSRVFACCGAYARQALPKVWAQGYMRDIATGYVQGYGTRKIFPCGKGLGLLCRLI